jgi:hypothetical protein
MPSFPTVQNTELGVMQLPKRAVRKDIRWEREQTQGGPPGSSSPMRDQGQRSDLVERGQ